MDLCVTQFIRGKDGTKINMRDSNEKSDYCFVEAICPLCRKRFKIYVYWKGPGVPRMYCEVCRKIIGRRERHFYGHAYYT